MLGVRSSEHGCADMRRDGTEGAIEITAQKEGVSEWYVFDGAAYSSPYLFPLLVTMSTVYAPLPNVLIHVHNVNVVVLLVCTHMLDPTGAICVGADCISTTDSPVDESGNTSALVRRIPGAVANRPGPGYKPVSYTHLTLPTNTVTWRCRWGAVG